MQVNLNSQNNSMGKNMNCYTLQDGSQNNIYIKQWENKELFTNQAKCVLINPNNYFTFNSSWSEHVT